MKSQAACSVWQVLPMSSPLDLSTLFAILRKISCQDDIFHIPVSFSVFHRHFQFVSFVSRGGSRIESQHFEHLLSNHKSFVPNHDEPLSSDFLTNDNVPRN